MCGDNTTDLLKIDLCNYNNFCSFIQNRKTEQISHIKIKKKKNKNSNLLYFMTEKALKLNVKLFGNCLTVSINNTTLFLLIYLNSR